MQKISKNYRELFDVSFCLEVSEYWYDPMMALKNIAKLLKQGGLLYITFHFLYPIHEPKEQDCLRYTRFGVEKLLKHAGFTIEDVLVRTEVEARFLEYCAAEKMRPAKTYNQHNGVGYCVTAKKL